jgi:hypothetical protein
MTEPKSSIVKEKEVVTYYRVHQYKSHPEHDSIVAHFENNRPIIIDVDGWQIQDGYLWVGDYVTVINEDNFIQRIK